MADQETQTREFPPPNEPGEGFRFVEVGADVAPDVDDVWDWEIGAWGPIPCPDFPVKVPPHMARFFRHPINGRPNITRLNPQFVELLKTHGDVPMVRGMALAVYGIALPDRVQGYEAIEKFINDGPTPVAAVQAARAVTLVPKPDRVRAAAGVEVGVPGRPAGEEEPMSLEALTAVNNDPDARTISVRIIATEVGTVSFSRQLNLTGNIPIPRAVYERGTDAIRSWLTANRINLRRAHMSRLRQERGGTIAGADHNVTGFTGIEAELR